MKKRTKWLWGCGTLAAAGAVAAILLLAVAALVARRVMDPGRLKGMAESRLSQALGRPVRVGAVGVSLLPLPKATVSGIAVGAGQGAEGPPLKLERVEAYPNLGDLLRGKLVIGRVDLAGVQVYLRRDPSGRWILPVAPEALKGTGGKGGADVSVTSVRLLGGRVTLEDQTLRGPSGAVQIFELENLSGRWSQGASGAAKADVSGSLAGGKATASVSFGKGVSALADLTGVQARALAPLLWSYARLAPTGGAVSIHGEASGSGFDAFDADVTADLQGLLSPGFGVRAAGFEPAPVTGKLTAKVVKRGGSFRFPSLKAALPHTTLAGSGTADDTGASLKLSASSVDGRDLPAIMALLGMAPVPGLSLEGKAPVVLEVRVPSGAGALSAAGSAAAETLRLGTLTVTDLKTPFRLARGSLTLDPLTFSAYGARQTGAVSLDLNRTPSAYTVTTQMTGLDVNEALTANTSAKNTLYGTGEASGRISGAGFSPGALRSTASGEADVKVLDGVIRNFPLLSAINDALKITATQGKDTKFDKMRGHFVIGGGRAHTDDLVLKAGELRVAAMGDIGFDLSLNLKASARFTAAKSEDLVRSVRELSRLRNASGEIEFPLSITGNLASPSIRPDLGGVVEKQLKDELKKSLMDLLK